MQDLKIIILDSQPVVREGLLYIIDDQPDLSVIADSSRGKDTLELVKRYSPDIVMIEIEMDGIDFSIVKKVKKINSQTRVIFFTSSDSPEIVQQSQRAGVDGFITKDEGRHTICLAIRTVGRGKEYFSRVALEPKPTTYTDARGRVVPTQHPLSLREVDVLCLVAQAKSAKEIASSLNISVKTVDRHKANIMSKLSIHSQTELARYAFRNGFVDA
jgi:DNA-binding NarL/FixJ family response regulator